jgi:hypothetical protein
MFLFILHFEFFFLLSLKCAVLKYFIIFNFILLINFVSNTHAYSKLNQVQVYWGINKVFLTKFIKRIKLKIIKYFKTAHFNESKKKNSKCKINKNIF